MSKASALRYGPTVAVMVILIGAIPSPSPSEPTSRLSMAGWSTKLVDEHPLEDDPQRNGRSTGAQLYSERLANMAGYTNQSKPVTGYYPAGYGTVIATDGPPVYYVDDTTPTVKQRVAWISEQDGLEYPPGAATNLQDQFLSVPIPAGPQGEAFEKYYHRPLAGAGPDQQLSIYNTSTHELWEFWRFRYNPNLDRYETAYGGYTKNVKRAPMALPNNWGARATSIPLPVGVMLQTEYSEGAFNHPLALIIPVVKPGYLPPATREDARVARNTVNSDSRDEIPEGAWFRLPPDHQIHSADPLLRMIEQAARDYGIIVVDGSGGATTFLAESTQAIGTPFSPLAQPAFPPQGKEGPYAGKENILKNFPWSKLVQIKYRN